MPATNTPLEGMLVAIFAMDGVENVELTEPRKALDQAGAKTTLFSPKQGKIQSLNVSVAAGIILYEVLRQRTLASAKLASPD